MNSSKAELISYHNKPRNSFSILWQALLILISVVGCIALGNLAQNVDMKFFALLIVCLVFWVAYLLLFGISVHSSLLLFSLFFVKPMEVSFYLILSFMLLLFLVELIQSGAKSLFIPYPIALALLLGFGILSASKINVSIGYNYFISTIVVPVITLSLFANAKITKTTMLRWMQLITAVGAVVGLYGTVIAVLNPLKRLGSFWVTAMNVNGFYTVAFFFAVALAMHQQKRQGKLLYATAACLILFGMLYTYTRMAILAVIFGFFLLMLKFKAMRYIGFIFVMLLPLVIPSSMVSRFEAGFTYDISLVIRAIAWYFAIQQILIHPFTGLGFSVWSTWYPGVIPLKALYAHHTHNVYLNLMVDMGIIGTAAYFYLVWQILRNFYKKCVKGASILPYGMWVAMMSLLFSCLTDIFIQQYSISLLFWVSLGIMLARENSEKLR